MFLSVLILVYKIFRIQILLLHGIPIDFLLFLLIIDLKLCDVVAILILN